MVHDPLEMHDVDGMTVAQHHAACLGILNSCYRHVPADLQEAIYQGIQAAKDMGAPVDPENVKRGLPLSLNQ